MRTCVPIVPNMISCISSTHLRLSNGKRLSLLLQQETRPYINGFALGCCDQSTTVSKCNHYSLMERDAHNERACEIHWKTTEKDKVGRCVRNVLPTISTIVRPLVKRPVGPAGKSIPLCG